MIDFDNHEEYLHSAEFQRMKDKRVFYVDEKIFDIVSIQYEKTAGLDIKLSSLTKIKYIWYTNETSWIISTIKGFLNIKNIIAIFYK